MTGNTHPLPRLSTESVRAFLRQRENRIENPN
jgi:hypothetical protein